MLIYSISDNYINYLRQFENKVYANVDPSYTYSRKYLGYVIEVNNWKYYIPLSSPKQNDYLPDGTIRRSIITIVRITDSSNSQLYGTLRISNMIPVPDSALIEYDVNAESDSNYKMLILNEISFLKANQAQISQYANALYKEKISGISTSNYLVATLDFRILENAANGWFQ